MIKPAENSVPGRLSTFHPQPGDLPWSSPRFLFTLSLLGLDRQSSIVSWSATRVVSEMTSASNVTTDQLGAAPLPPGLIGNKELTLIKQLGILLSLGMGLVGSIFNCINIAVFLKLGAKDCVSICLLSLSVTDFSCLSFAAICGACDLLEATGLYFYVDPRAVFFQASFVSSMGYDMSTYITSFISLERCLCVALPFHFKDMFTFRRALCVVISLCTFTLACYLPIFATSGLRVQWDSRTNSTRILTWYSEHIRATTAFLNLWNQLILAVISLFIVLVSTQVMVRGLQKSSQFQRERATKLAHSTSDHKPGGQTPGNVSAGQEAMTSPASGSQGGQASQKAREKNSSDHMSTKNRRVVQMVTTLAAICIVCNTSRLLLVAVLRIKPDISFGRRYQNLYVVIVKCALIAQLINATCNMFVYIKLNPSYRTTFFELFGSTHTKRK